MTAKYAMTYENVDFLDLCFVRTLIMFVSSFCTVYLTKTSLFVPKEYRMVLLLRAVVGTIGFTIIVLAFKLMPISVVTILVNTAPFWCSIF